MKTWEDIFKDKLKGREIPLPEESLVEFRAKLDGAASAQTEKRFPLAWAFAAVVAAGLAAVLLLHKPAMPEGDIQIIQKPSAPIAVVTDSITVDEPGQATPLIAQVVIPKAPRHPQVIVADEERQNQVNEPEIVEEENLVSEPDKAESVEETVPEIIGDKTSDLPDDEVVSISGPSIQTGSKPNLKVAPAAGGLLGTSALAALATTLSAGNYEEPIVIGPDGPTEDLVKAHSHYFPVKIGLQTWIPIADRLYLSTGLEYSMYFSRFSYLISGEKRQAAHYIGIPVHLDYVIASNNRYDVYLGAGMQGDLCIAAYLDGNRIQKDKPSISLLGVGGFQMNLSKNIGIYIEPGLSWRIPVGSYVLETYRSDKPVSFTVSAGLRFSPWK